MKMQSTICIYLVVLYALVIIWIPATESQERSLILTQVIYRHGDRSPMDASENVTWQDDWTDGYAQLTNLGKRQQYELGQYFRQRYGKLLNTTYKKEEIRVMSSDRDRTMMSAYCNLAGLYPPQGEQVWNKDIKWQPIPVHIISPAEQHLLLHPVDCPKYNNIMKTIDELKKASKQNHNFTQTDSDNAAVLKMLLGKQFRFEGGPLLGEIINNMEKKLRGNVTEKMFMYSGHDVSLLNLLQLLGLYNGIFPPPYCTTVMVELYEFSNGGRTIQLFFRNTTSLPPYELSIPNCPSPCPYEQFKLVTSSMVITDLAQECQDNGQP